MITKRQLGIGVATFAFLLGLGILSVDWLGAGNEVGIGPTQRLGLIAASAILLLGLTLIPLGDRPA